MARKKVLHTHVHKKKDRSLTVFVIAAGLLILILAATYLLTQGTASQPSGTVLARVNGQEITQQEIDGLYNRLPDQLKVPNSKLVLVNQTIDEILLKGEAARLGISIAPADVDSEFNALLAQNGYDEAGFRAFLAEREISYDDIRRDFADQLLIFKVVNESVISTIEVTDEEIVEFYNVNQISGYNLTLTNDTKSQIKSLLLNQKISTGVASYIAQLRASANIEHVQAPK